MRVVRGLLDAAERAGVPRAHLLHAAQLDADELDAVDARLERRRTYQVIACALDLADDPALGLHWAGQLREGTLTPISYLLATSATLRQALNSLSRFCRLVSDEPGFEIATSAAQVSVRAHGAPSQPIAVQRFLSEMVIGGFYALVRSFAPHATPSAVAFAHPAPAYRAAYDRFFGVVVRFEQPLSQLVCDSALLDVPGLSRDDEAYETLEALAAQQVLRLTDHVPFSVQVHEFLVRQGPPYRSDMTVVARALKLSVRSLRRYLAAEGTTYQAIAGKALGGVAKRLLREDRKTIHETAHEMGFTNPSTFQHAFKRWTTLTPGAYRAEH